jgi:hypothetical protein
MAVSEKDTATDAPEKCLWGAAEQFRLKKFEMRISIWKVESLGHLASAIPDACSTRYSSLIMSPYATTSSPGRRLEPMSCASPDALAGK